MDLADRVNPESLFEGVLCPGCNAEILAKEFFGKIPTTLNSVRAFWLNGSCGLVPTIGIALDFASEALASNPCYILGSLVKFECSECGALPVSQDEFQLVPPDRGYRSHMITRRCGTCSKVVAHVVIVRSVRGGWSYKSSLEKIPQSSSEEGEALSVDDVLSAHETLRNYGGDIHGLFTGKPK